MKTLLILCSTDEFSHYKERYEKYIEKQLVQKEFGNIFVVIYSIDSFRKNKILCMRWVGIGLSVKDSWDQHFWCDDSVYYLPEGFNVSFESQLIDRLLHIKAKSVYVTGDANDGFFDYLKSKLSENKIIIEDYRVVL